MYSVGLPFACSLYGVLKYFNLNRPVKLISLYTPTVGWLFSVLLCGFILNFDFEIEDF